MIGQEPFEQARRRILASINTKLDQLFSDKLPLILSNLEDFWRLGADEAKRRLAETGSNDLALVDELFAQANQALLAPLPVDGETNQQMQLIPRIAKKAGISALSVTEEHLRLLGQWGETEQFQTNMALIFGRYRDMLLGNSLKQLADGKTGSSTSLSDDDFEQLFGRPPWEQLRESFQSFGLTYRPKPPNLFDYSPVHFTLLKEGTDTVVATENLSSGEKVLLQFALSTFSFDEHFVNVKRPKLLLLDEMDASLHPEMVHRWFGVIRDGLVGQQGMTCVVTTHAPTTVALAPEEALFEMIDGRSGLRKISKQDALNRLTFGVPTLSIDYSGRRQVFAESDTDAAIYERVYALIKAAISCERELNFLSTGMRTKDGGEINSGCTIVNNIVQQMTDFGARNVFGIVDWDGATVSTDRVKVVAEGLRDGIENVLLDPLLICLLLMKLRRAPEGLHDIDRFTGAETLDSLSLQRLADAVQHEVFSTATGKTEVRYLGGATVNVLNEYLTINDHDLEAALTRAFPVLNKWARNRGELVKAVIEEVLTEHRGFCPVELGTVFETIANAPA